MDPDRMAANRPQACHHHAVGRGLAWRLIARVLSVLARARSPHTLAVPVTGLLMAALGLVAIGPERADGQLDLDRLLRGFGQSPGSGLDETKIAQGLKEALRVGTENAVALTGRLDGYLANQAIKILMPPELSRLESGLRAIGLGAKVDEFVVSMNRAAEQAAPQARQIFVDAITGMSFADARRILGGGDTAATDYFRDTTTDRLTTAFRPVVEQKLGEVGVTRQYKDLFGRARTLPFLNVEGYDIDTYVVGKSLDGLFHVLGEEERKIRRDPAARASELLRDVFGR